MRTVTQSLWQLRLLDTFELQRDGSSVDVFGSRREEQLLAYLSVRSPTPVGRDIAAADLWPESDGPTARKNLSFNLFVLKNRLAKVGADELIQERRKTLRLAPALEIDAIAFAEYLAAAVATSSVAERVILLERATALYGGGLLPGMNAPWLAPHQARFESLFNQTLELLASSVQADKTLHSLILDIPSTAWQTAGRVFAPAPAQPLPQPAEEVATTATPKAVDWTELGAFAAAAEVGLGKSEEKAKWLEDIGRQEGEIEAALRSAFEDQNFAGALGVAVGLWRYWYFKGTAGTGQRWLERLLAAPYTPSPRERAQALHAMGTLSYYAGKRHAARKALEEAVVLWSELDDAAELLRSLTNLGIALFGIGDLDAAAAAYAQGLALAESLEKTNALDTILGDAALCEIRRLDAPAARGLLLRRLALLGGEEASQDGRLASTYAHLATVELMEDRFAEAQAQARKAARIYQVVGDARGQALAERLLGRVAYQQGQLKSAEEHMGEAARLARTTNSLWELGTSLGYLAVVLEASGRESLAASTMWHAVTLLRAAGDVGAIERFQAEIQNIKQGRGAVTPALFGQAFIGTAD